MRIVADWVLEWTKYWEKKVDILVFYFTLFLNIFSLAKRRISSEISFMLPKELNSDEEASVDSFDLCLRLGLSYAILCTDFSELSLSLGVFRC